MARKRSVRASVTLPDGKSMEQVQSAAQQAVQKLYGDTYPGSTYSWVRATLDGELIVQHGEKQWRHAWSIDADGIVTVEPERTEVVEKITYEPVSASITFEVFGAAKTGRKLEVRVIGTGEGANSENGARWFVPATEDGIGSAKKVFGGARVHWHAAAGKFDHVDKALSDWLGSAHDVGYLSDLRVDADGLFASLNLDDDTPDFVREALVEKRVGLSVEAAAERRPVVRDGKKYVELVRWCHPEGGAASVAIVSHPALRGEVLAVAASRKETSMSQPVAAPAAPAAPAVDPVAEAQKVLAAIQTHEAKASVRASVTAAKLPEVHADRVIASVCELVELDPTLRGEKLATRVAAAIEAERKLLPAPQVNASGARVEVGAGPQDKFAVGVERLLIGTAPDRVQKRFADFAGHKGKVLASREQDAGIGLGSRVYSWRRLVRETMGVEVEDLLRPGRGAREVRASVNLATWGDVFENVLNKAGLAYQEDPDFSDWRKIVQIRNFTGSTLKQERMVTGGYANLPSVSEGAVYTAASTPADQGHGYTVLKYGYTEEWTREAQINDNFGQLAEIVRKMALAADRTKYECFFDKITIAGQPTMDYDSTALYHNDHGANLATTALSATQLKARRLNMRKQADISNSKRLGLEPKYLIVPVDLAETAYDCLKPLAEYPGGSTTDNSFIRLFGIEPIVVRHWTNAKDWFLMADPVRSSIPVYEAGFLDGKEMAEIFVQDMANAGSVFERDTITVKIAQDYFGGSPMRDEAFDGNDVA